MVLTVLVGSGCLATNGARTHQLSDTPAEKLYLCDPPAAAALIPELKGVVIIPSAEGIKAGGRPGVVGTVVEGPDFLTSEKVQAQLKSFFGRGKSIKEVV